MQKNLKSLLMAASLLAGIVMTFIACGKGGLDEVSDSDITISMQQVGKSTNGGGTSSGTDQSSPSSTGSGNDGSSVSGGGNSSISGNGSSSSSDTSSAGDSSSSSDKSSSSNGSSSNSSVSSSSVTTDNSSSSTDTSGNGPGSGPNDPITDGDIGGSLAANNGVVYLSGKAGSKNNTNNTKIKCGSSRNFTGKIADCYPNGATCGADSELSGIGGGGEASVPSSMLHCSDSDNNAKCDYFVKLTLTKDNNGNGNWPTSCKLEG